VNKSGLRIDAIHTCPMWEGADGSRRPGVEYDPTPHRVVGWCNVAYVHICGLRYRLLLTLDAK
jgi:hypothetical protein